MLSRLITAETGNYDRASLKIPSLTVSLGKQLELISPADLIYNHTFSWRQESHFAPLIRRRKPRPLRFPVVQLYPCWYNLSISNYETMDTSVLSHRFSSFDEKKEKRNFNHCTREISSRHFFVTFHALSNPIEFSNSRALVEKGRRSFIAHPVSIPFEIGRWRDYLKFGRRRDSINGACLIYGKTMRGSNGSKTGSVDWEYLGTLRFELIEIGRICRVRLLKHVTVR